ncbi:DUF973 family protein [Stygiolobus caldivivus]|uniref:DUF973 family protein n=1 Tax=Stygiolobus caldivivus TaxID=2824673 RepID=A0A8D5U462_9CREN|nr:DUF973 family protein [Stygiolobus caldivivus]BCU68922.1 hypothetical protein KN1_02190 [Stygiolobus caldivivus]
MSWDLELLGLNKLKSGALYMFIAPFLLIVAVILIVVTGFVSAFFSQNNNLPTSPSSGLPVITPSQAGGLLAGLTVGAILAFISLILSLVGIFSIRSGFGNLSYKVRDVEIGKTGTTLIIVNIILSFILPIVILLFAFLAPSSFNPIDFSLFYDGIQIILLILGVIGNILIGIGYYRVGNIYGSDATRIGGILIATIILSIVGFILAYIGLGGIINKIRSGGQPVSQGTYYPQPPYVQPAIYQEGGQGILTSQGVLNFQVYSTVPATLILAFIEGVNISTSTIWPQSIPPNQITNVTAKFTPIQVTPNAQYRVRVTALVNGVTTDFVVIAVGT